MSRLRQITIQAMLDSRLTPSQTITTHQHLTTQKSIKANTKINLPWGDSLHHKHDEHCRIIFSNINGIPHYNNVQNTSQVCMAADTAKADILCLAETNLDWNHGNIKHNFTSQVHQYWQCTQITTSSSDLRYNSPTQYGGTATIVGNPWSGRSTTSSKDPTSLRPVD